MPGQTAPARHTHHRARSPQRSLSDIGSRSRGASRSLGTLGLVAFGLCVFGADTAAQAERQRAVKRELRGRVEGRTGQPAANATVELRIEAAATPQALGLEARVAAMRIRCDERGRFRATIPAGAVARAWAHDAQSASAVEHGLRAGRFVRLRLRAAGRIDVHPGAQGPALDGAARVWLWSSSPSHPSEFVLFAGRLRELPPLPLARVRMRVLERSGYAFEQSVQLRPRSSTRVNAKLLAPCTLHLKGAAKGWGLRVPSALQYGEAKLGAWLEVKGGRANVPGLGLVCDVELRAPDGSRWPLRVGPLSSGQTHALQLPDAELGRLLVEAQPESRVVILSHERDRVRRRVVRTSSESPLVVKGVPPGTLLVVEARPDRSLALAAVEPAGGRDERRVRCTQLANGSLDLSLRGHDGLPMRETRVAMRALELDGLDDAKSARRVAELLPTLHLFPDRLGTLRVGTLPNGVWEITTMGAFHIAQRKRVKITGHEPQRLELRLELGLQLVGRVVDAKGKPVPRVLVRLRDRAGQDPARETVSDAKGAFSFEGLREIAYVLEAQRSIGTRSELGRLRSVYPGDDGVELVLKDEDPRRGIRR